jgi:hypothetical protein
VKPRRYGGAAKPDVRREEARAQESAMSD